MRLYETILTQLNMLWIYHKLNELNGSRRVYAMLSGSLDTKAWGPQQTASRYEGFLRIY
jgi:hypothetical protein